MYFTKNVLYNMGRNKLPREIIKKEKMFCNSYYNF